MDLLQKSTNLVERQRKRKEKLMKEDENCNRIDEAVNYFLKSNNVGPDDLANQQMYLKANQVYFTRFNGKLFVHKFMNF